MATSKFSLSYKHGLSMNMGKIVPIGWKAMLPGDIIRGSTTGFVRAAPLLSPVMHKIKANIYHCFVPNRLLWDEWEDFITGGPDGTSAPVHPYMTSPAMTGYAIGSLADYLGIPPGVPSKNHSALPFRAYSLIFNELMRDQDLVTERVVDLTSGADTTTDLTLATAAWEKNYFTTCRPWPQKGPSVILPLGDTAPVIRSSNAANQVTFRAVGANTALPAGALSLDGTGIHSGGGTYGSYDPNGTLVASLASATGVDINDVRLAFALMRKEENRARYGSRIYEYLLAAFNVLSQDARLQLPEVWGYGEDVLQISEVLQTGPNDDTGEGVATLRGHGAAVARSNRFLKFVPEHGIFMTLMVIRPKMVFGNGLEREWQRATSNDYYQPEMAHIGQQQVMKSEAYWADSGVDPVFGYQDRYDEYRRSESRISGEFRDTLDFWNLAQIYGSNIALNEAFINCTPDPRPWAAPSADQYYVDVTHSIQCRRVIPQVGTSFVK